MKAKRVLVASLFAMPLSGAAGQTALPPPHFHHLALNSTDPEAAIAFYLKEFPSTSRTSWEGTPALVSPTHVMILFQKTLAPPPADPDITAYWHFPQVTGRFPRPEFAGALLYRRPRQLCRHQQ